MTYYDEPSASLYTVYSYNQWVSWDNHRSWQAKLEYLNGHCISGLMIWSIDQDTATHYALSALFGEGMMANSLVTGGDLSRAQAIERSNQFVPLALAPSLVLTSL